MKDFENFENYKETLDELLEMYGNDDEIRRYVHMKKQIEREDDFDNHDEDYYIN